MLVELAVLLVPREDDTALPEIHSDLCGSVLLFHRTQGCPHGDDFLGIQR